MASAPVVMILELQLVDVETKVKTAVVTVNLVLVAKVDDTPGGAPVKETGLLKIKISTITAKIPITIYSDLFILLFA